MTDSGLLCPKCNGGTIVYDSRPQSNGTTKRYRECLHCGARFKTIERYNFKSIKLFGIKAERKPRKMKTEDYRAKDMIYLRETGMTYEEIGKQFGVSRQRVYQIISKGGSNKTGAYISQDITFCSNRKCENKKCERNHCHIDWQKKPYHSFSDFENTEYCPKKRSEQS